MSQDLIRALGARLEAQLNARETRFKSVEESVKAKVSANPPAAFSLLPDGTKQFGYAPSVDSAPAVALLDEAAPDTEDISDSTAPFAALVSAAAQIFTEAAAAEKSAAAVSAIAAPTSEPVNTTPAEQNPIMLTGSASPVDVPIAVTIASATEATAASTAPAVATPAVATPVVAAAAATATPTATASTTAAIATASAAPIAALAAATADVPASAAARTVTSIASTANTTPGWVMLSDGTKQFGYAPTGATPGVNVPIAKTPPVPADFGAGATMRRKGSTSDIPITVTRIGDGVVFANFTDSEGTREMAFYPNQMDLVTAAP